MSADRWDTCPQCEARAAAAREQARLKAERSYGKVSREEYTRLVAIAEAPPEKLKETLRENFQFGVCSTNRDFFFQYNCECSVCGFEYSHRFDEPITVTLKTGEEDDG